MYSDSKWILIRCINLAVFSCVVARPRCPYVVCTHKYVCDDLNVCKAKITCHCFWNLWECAQKQEHSNTHIFAFCGLNPIEEDKKTFHFWIHFTTFCLRLNIWRREGGETLEWLTHQKKRKGRRTQTLGTCLWLGCNCTHANNPFVIAPSSGFCGSSPCFVWIFQSKNVVASLIFNSIYWQESRL